MSKRRLDDNYLRLHRSMDYQTPATYASGSVFSSSSSTSARPPARGRFANSRAVTQPGAKTGVVRFVFQPILTCTSTVHPMAHGGCREDLWKGRWIECFLLRINHFRWDENCRSGRRACASQSLVSVANHASKKTRRKSASQRATRSIPSCCSFSYT